MCNIDYIDYKLFRVKIETKCMYFWTSQGFMLAIFDKCVATYEVLKKM